MAFKVITIEPAWDGFLRRAKRAFPIEHCEALWGTPTIDSFRITDFVPMRKNKAGTNANTIDYDVSELRRQRSLARAAGKEFLGTVHTHPHVDYDTAPTDTDHHEGAKDGERIMGILQLYKKDSRFVANVNWWFPQPKIEFEILNE